MKHYRDGSAVKWSFIMRFLGFETSCIYGFVLGALFSPSTFKRLVKSCPGALCPIRFVQPPSEKAFLYYVKVGGEKWDRFQETNPETSSFYGILF